MVSKGKRITIGIPNTGWIHKELVVYLLKTTLKYHKQYSINIDVQSGKPLESTRNRIVKKFLEDDGDYLFFIDSDNPPSSKNNPIELVEEDFDIVVMPTPMWAAANRDVAASGIFPIKINAMQSIGEKYDESPYMRGIQEIDGAGTGCMLIARRVFEKVYPAFERIFDEHGITEYGSDLYFCRKARDKGFKIHAHYDYPCSHYKEINLLDAWFSMQLRDITQLHRIPKDNPNTVEYWDKEWSRRDERILPFYNDVVNACEGKVVVDFGCGRGDLLHYLSKKAKKAVGVEQSTTALDILKKRELSGCKSLTEAWSKYNPDIIVCTEVLEHLDDDVYSLQWLLKYCDTLIYSVPNNWLTPAAEPEHRRVYTIEYVKEITPELKNIYMYGGFLVVVCGKDIPYPIENCHVIRE